MNDMKALFPAKMYLFSCLLLAICFSCSKSAKELETLFNQVESIVEQQPDSALALLNTILFPEDLKESRYNQFLLLQIQAKDKSYQDITSDTIIFKVKEYYIQKNDYPNASLAAYYCGRVLYEQKEYEKAIQTFLETANHAKKINNETLEGLCLYSIGEIHYNQYLFDNAIEKFKSALSCYSKFPEKYKRISQTFNIIANSFFINKQRDSAFVYYDKALQVAKKHNDIEEQITILQNTGAAYKEINNLQLAKENLLTAKAMITDKENAFVFFNLAQVYNDLNIKDSAEYYINTALPLFSEDKNKSSLAGVYGLLSRMEEKNKNLEKALDYQRKYTKQISAIFGERKDENIAEIQKKFDFEPIQNEKNKLLVQRQWIFLIISVLFFAIVSISFYLYRKYYQDKTERLKLQIHLSALEQNNLELQELTNSLNKKESISKALLFENLEIFKRANSMEYDLEIKKTEAVSHIEHVRRIKEILYGKQDYDWDTLYRVLDNVYHNRFSEIRQEYPCLTEEEFKIVCLTCSDFDNIKITYILGRRISEHTVQQRKSQIRHKLGIENRGDMKVFFNIKSPDKKK
ncbi:hypothetical protein FACS189432_02860 [Bacteroidia bacterium]|nr:hypothetical protein FACS189426_19150 [Bacteroidia bacterium]GHT27092.1 hypothetical protein FACS189432_02860 [Bacteroidia bacterium]GHV71137.1 hypothetical protein FACS189420_5090 [Bacteroidia bacterium]